MRLFHPSLHVLDQLGQLPIFIILFLQSALKLIILLLHLRNQGIALLKLFLDDFELLRISKGILRSNDLLELVSQTHALFTIMFEFNLKLLLACAANVALQIINLV